MRDELLIPDATSLMQSMRSIGYNFQTAVADIIDNSIYAEAKNVSIYYETDVNEPYFAILDDGFGMTEEKLTNAMKYGAKSPTEKREKKDLGRFGIGLKSASMSQCRKLTVVSKKNGTMSAAIWDLDHVIETNSWKVLKYLDNEVEELGIDYIEDLKKQETGTIVYWEKFDRISVDTSKLKEVFINLMERTENHLALVFHRFLEDNLHRLNITLNDNPISPIDPFLRTNPASQSKPEQRKKIQGEVIEVVPHILPHLNKMKREEIKSLGGKDNLKSSQGYYIYRNKRLIIWGKWFNQYPKQELAKLVRVQVDIPNSLDDLWEIDIKKSQAVLPYIIRKNLGMMINEALESGKDVFKYRGKRKNRHDEFQPIWNRIEDRGSIRYEINRGHNIIKEYLDKIGLSSELNALMSFVEEYIPTENIYLDRAEDKAINRNEKNTKTDDYFERLRLLDKNKALEMLDFIDKYEGFEMDELQKKELRERILDAQ